jgi:hypothetical protein
MTVALLIVLALAVAFAAFQFSEARRWRETAAEVREENRRKSAELEEAKMTALQQAAESNKNREA